MATAASRDWLSHTQTITATAAPSSSSLRDDQSWAGSSSTRPIAVSNASGRKVEGKALPRQNSAASAAHCASASTPSRRAGDHTSERAPYPSHASSA